MKVAFYGGSFDPPHLGHLFAAVYLSVMAGFDRVLVVPVFEHVFHKPLTPFEHRYRLCQLTFGSLPAVEVSAIESELSGPSYTLATLQALVRSHPEWQLRLVVGADVLNEIPLWHAYQEVTHMAPLYVLGRRGCENANAPPAFLPEVSSTAIRNALHHSKPGERPPLVLDSLVPSVLEEIERRGLYR